MCFFDSFTVTFIFSCPSKMLNFNSQEVPQRSHIPMPPNRRQRPPISSHYPHRNAAKPFFESQGISWGGEGEAWVRFHTMILIYTDDPKVDLEQSLVQEGAETTAVPHITGKEQGKGKAWKRVGLVPDVSKLIAGLVGLSYVNNTGSPTMAEMATSW